MALLGAGGGRKDTTSVVADAGSANDRQSLLAIPIWRIFFHLITGCRVINYFSEDAISLRPSDAYTSCTHGCKLFPPRPLATPFDVSNDFFSPTDDSVTCDCGLQILAGVFEIQATVG